MQYELSISGKSGSTSRRLLGAGTRRRSFYNSIKPLTKERKRRVSVGRRATSKPSPWFGRRLKVEFWVWSRSREGVGLLGCLSVSVSVGRLPRQPRIKKDCQHKLRRQFVQLDTWILWFNNRGRWHFMFNLRMALPRRGA